MPQIHPAFPSPSRHEEGWILMIRDASVKTPLCAALRLGQKNDPAWDEPRYLLVPWVPALLSQLAGVLPCQQPGPTAGLLLIKFQLPPLSR